MILPSLRNKISEDSIGDVLFWEDQLHQGICADYSINMIRCILDYQAGRLLKTKSFNDPTTVMLDEFKNWLITLSGYTHHEIEACLKDIERRIAYLSDLNDSKLFPPGNHRGHVTRLSLLCSLKETLKEEVTIFVKVLPGYATAREQYELLATESDKLLKSGVQVLYLALRNQEEIGKYARIYDKLKKENIHNDDYPQSVVKTLTGLFLQKLVFQCQLMEMAQDRSKKLEVIKVPFNSPIRNSITSAESDAVNLDLTSNIIIKNNNSGIEEFFLKKKQEATLQIFIDLHGLFYDLAKIIMLVKQGYRVAGIGNTLLLYDLLNQETKVSLNDYTALLQKINAKMNAFETSIKPRLKKEMTLRTPSSWGENYKAAEKEIKLFMQSFDKINNNISAITQWICTINLPFLLREAQKEMIDYASISYAFRNYLCENHRDLNLSPLEENLTHLRGNVGSDIKSTMIADDSEDEEKEDKEEKKEDYPDSDDEYKSDTETGQKNTNPMQIMPYDSSNGLSINNSNIDVNNQPIITINSSIEPELDGSAIIRSSSFDLAECYIREGKNDELLLLLGHGKEQVSTDRLTQLIEFEQKVRKKLIKGNAYLAQADICINIINWIKEILPHAVDLTPSDSVGGIKEKGVFYERRRGGLFDDPMGTLNKCECYLRYLYYTDPRKSLSPEFVKKLNHYLNQAIEASLNGLEYPEILFRGKYEALFKKYDSSIAWISQHSNNISHRDRYYDNEEQTIEKWASPIVQILLQVSKDRSEVLIADLVECIFRHHFVILKNIESNFNITKLQLKQKELDEMRAHSFASLFLKVRKESDDKIITEFNRIGYPLLLLLNILNWYITKESQANQNQLVRSTQKEILNLENQCLPVFSTTNGELIRYLPPDFSALEKDNVENALAILIFELNAMILLRSKYEVSYTVDQQLADIKGVFQRVSLMVSSERAQQYLHSEFSTPSAESVVVFDALNRKEDVTQITRRLDNITDEQGLDTIKYNCLQYAIDQRSIDLDALTACGHALLPIAKKYYSLEFPGSLVSAATRIAHGKTPITFLTDANQSTLLLDAC